MLWRLKLRKILNLYSSWGKEITGEKIKTSWSSDFFCAPDSSHIWIGMLISEQNIEELTRFLKQNFDCRFNFEAIEMFTLGFLHEVGHLESDWQFDEQDKEKDIEHTTAQYRMLPHEFEADRWAVEWINENLASVQEWQQKLRDAYKQITPKDLEKFATHWKGDGY